MTNKVSQNDEREEELEKMKQWFSKPFLDLFTEGTHRARRNLIISASLILTYKIISTGVNIEESRFLGVKFTGIKEGGLDIALVFIVSYLLIHFIWCALDDFSAWRLRLTGMNASVPASGMFPTAADSDPGGHLQEQITLSAWWVANIRQAAELETYLTLSESLKNSSIEAGKVQATTHINNIQKQEALINQTLGIVTQLKNRSVIIEAALNQYEAGFFRLGYSQRFRWRFIEFYLPVFLGFWALYLLLSINEMIEKVVGAI